MADASDIRGEFTSRDHALEVISAILLSLTTLTSAWSAYQATRWSGVQATEFSRAGSLRIESSKMNTVAQRKISIQTGLFVQYIASMSQNNDTLSEFLINRFPPELSKATRAWLKTNPLKNPDAPPSPFDMPEYQIMELQEVQALTVEANHSFEKAKVANQNGDNYVLLIVLFASVLFFSGVAPKFRAFSLRVVMLSLGGMIFIVSSIILSTYPVH